MLSILLELLPNFKSTYFASMNPPNMVYLSQNKNVLVRTLLLDLYKHTYLMLEAKYKDKLNTSTEYCTL